MSSALGRSLRRELLLAFRRRGELANPLLFFVMVAALVPLGISPQASVLAGLAAGMIWVMALLATLLSLEPLFAEDYRDGTLEQLLLAPQGMAAAVLGKILCHWLVTGLPLTLMAPLLATLLALPTAGWPALLLGLAVGTLALSLIGAMGAALTVSLQRSGVLLTLIVMPLYVPVIIFGSAAVQRAIEGFSWLAPLALLGSISLLALALCPLVVVGALRLTASE
jgi:heme exporter protein B